MSIIIYTSNLYMSKNKKMQSQPIAIIYKLIGLQVSMYRKCRLPEMAYLHQLRLRRL